MAQRKPTKSQLDVLENMRRDLKLVNFGGDYQTNFHLTGGTTLKPVATNTVLALIATGHIDPAPQWDPQLHAHTYTLKEPTT